MLAMTSSQSEKKTNTSSHPEIINKAIIIGGGPCGSITALALQRKGIKCHVYEKIDKDRPNDAGNVLTLHGAVDCIKYLGYAREWEEIVDIPGCVEYRSNTGHLYFRFDSVEASEFGFISRPTLYNICQKWCTECSNGIEYSFGKKFVYYTENKDSNTVTAYFDDGTFDTGNILIGADGLNSSVRKCMIGETENKQCKIFSTYSFYYFHGNLDDVYDIEKYPKNVFEINDDAKAVIFCKMLPKDNKYALAIFYKTLSVTNTKWNEKILNINDEKLNKIFEHKWSINWFKLVEKSKRKNHISIFTINLRRPWYSNRVIIMGDAAHAFAPFGGQGANQAIYDALELANMFGKNQNKPLNKLSNQEVDKIFNTFYKFRSEITARKCAQSLKGMNIWFAPVGVDKFKRKVMFALLSIQYIRRIVKNYVSSRDISFPLQLKENRVSIFNFSTLFEWIISFGYTSCSLGLLLAYCSSIQGGYEYWVKYKKLRRVFLVSGICFGVASQILFNIKHNNQSKTRYPFMIIPRLLHLAISLSLVYLEYFKGVQHAKYSVAAISLSWITAKINTK